MPVRAGRAAFQLLFTSWQRRFPNASFQLGPMHSWQTPFGVAWRGVAWRRTSSESSIAARFFPYPFPVMTDSAHSIGSTDMMTPMYWLDLYNYPTIWSDECEGVVMPFCALLGWVFNKGKPYLTFHCVGNMIASRTKDEPRSLSFLWP